MTKTLEMFSLCLVALVDLGQHFFCNLAVITKEGYAGKTGRAFLSFSPNWKSSDPSGRLIPPDCRGNEDVALFIQRSDTCDSDRRNPLFSS